MSYINQNIMDTFYTIPTTNKGVEKIIAIFKDSAAGCDNLKPCIIRKIRQCIATPLVHIYNLSFIDLRTAQVYCDPFFLVSQEVSLNFHHFCG